MDFLHLLFNGSALWSLGVVEALGPAAGYGTAYYLQTSLILLLFSGAVRVRPPFGNSKGPGLRVPRFLCLSVPRAMAQGIQVPPLGSAKG